MTIRIVGRLLFIQLLLVVLVAGPLPAFASEPVRRCPGGVTTVASSEFATGKLANGIQYAIEKRSGHPPSILFAVNAGGTDHPPEQGEVAHIIEHIGLASYTEQDDQLSRMVRAQQIETVNGATGSKNTTYFVNALPGTDASPQQLLSIVKYWLQDIPIRANFAREKAVVLTEASRTDTSDLKDQNRRSVYLFGSKSQIPFMFLEGQSDYRNILDLVLRAKQEDAEAFYRKWYRPDLATVVVVGDVNVAAWRSGLESALGGLANPPGPSPRKDGKRAPNAYIAASKLRLPSRVYIESSGSGDATLAIVTRTPRDTTYSDSCVDQRQDVIAKVASSGVNEIVRALQASPGIGTEMQGLKLASTSGVEDVALDATQILLPLRSSEGHAADKYGAARRGARAAVVALRIIERFGIDQATLRSTKHSLKTRLFGKVKQGELTEPYARMVYANGGNLLYRPLSRSAEMEMIDSVTVQDVNAYLRRRINFKDLAVALTAPAPLLDDHTLRASIDRGITEGMAEPLFRVPTVASVPVIWPDLSARPLSPDLFTRDGDMAKAILPGGQTLIVRNVKNPASFHNVALSFGAPGNFDALLDPEGKRYLKAEARATLLPERPDADAFARFAKENAVGMSIEVRPGLALARVTASPMDPETLFQSGRALLKAFDGTGKVKLRAATATRAESGPLSRWGSGEHAVDPIPTEELEKSVAGLEPRYIVISGDLALDKMISLASKFFADLPRVKNRDTGHYRPIQRVRPQTLLTETEKTPSLRSLVFSMEVSATEAPAMEVVAELFYLKLYGEARSLGAYELAHGVRYGPLSYRSGRRVLDIGFSSPADQLDKKRFDAAVDRVSRDVASGNFDEALFKRAARGALERRYNEVALVDLNDWLIEDLIVTGEIARQYQDLGEPILTMDFDTVRKAAARLMSVASISR